MEPKYNSGSNYASNRSSVNNFWEEQNKKKAKNKIGLANLVQGYNVLKQGLTNTKMGNVGLSVAEKYAPMDASAWEKGGAVPEWLKKQYTQETLQAVADSYVKSEGADLLGSTIKQGVSPDAGVQDVTTLGKTASEMGEAGVGVAEASSTGLGEVGSAVMANPYAVVAMLIAGLAKGTNKKGTTLNRWFGGK